MSIAATSLSRFLALTLSPAMSDPKIVTCDHCGSKAFGVDAFCPRCGQRLIVPSLGVKSLGWIALGVVLLLLLVAMAAQRT